MQSRVLAARELRSTSWSPALPAGPRAGKMGPLLQGPLARHGARASLESLSTPCPTTNPACSSSPCQLAQPGPTCRPQACTAITNGPYHHPEAPLPPVCVFLRCCGERCGLPSPDRTPDTACRLPGSVPAGHTLHGGNPSPSPLPPPRVGGLPACVKERDVPQSGESRLCSLQERGSLAGSWFKASAPKQGPPPATHGHTNTHTERARRE